MSEEKINKGTTIQIVVFGILSSVALYLGHWIICLVLLLSAGMIGYGYFLSVMNKPSVVVPETETEEKTGFEYRRGESVLDMDRQMKSTDIPNGFVFLGTNKKPCLGEFDEDGHVKEEFLENLSLGNWLSPIIKGGFPPDMVILVHCVMGDEQHLVKSLQVNKLLSNGKPVTFRELVNRKLAKNFVETIRKRYMDEFERKKSDSPASSPIGCEAQKAQA